MDYQKDTVGWVKEIRMKNNILGFAIIILLNAYYWVNVYYYGFFVSTMWTIVIAAIAGIIIKIKENRY